MTNDVQQLQSTVNSILQSMQAPSYTHFDFWDTFVGTVGSLVGLGFAVAAFVQARRAKRAAERATAAARKAGGVVKNLTIANELIDVKGLLRDLKRGMSWDDARDLLTRISQPIIGSTAFFQKDGDVKVKFDALLDTLNAAEKALDQVKPVSQDEETKVPDSVYNQMEFHHRAIGKALANFLGHLDRENITANLDDENENVT